MTDSIRKTIVDEHNKLRSTLALGKAQNKSSGFLPSGSNINKLSYDCNLEKETQEWIDKCTFQHAPLNGAASENIYQAWGSDMRPETHFPKGINMWWSELATKGFNSNDTTLTMDLANSGILHFTAVAWAKSSKVGCGFSNVCQKNGMTVVYMACRYTPSGNWINSKIYEKGQPCSACPNGASCSSTEGLCVV